MSVFLTFCANVIGARVLLDPIALPGTNRPTSVFGRVAHPGAVLETSRTTTRAALGPVTPGGPMPICVGTEKNGFFLIIPSLKTIPLMFAPTGPSQGGTSAQSAVSSSLPMSQVGFPPASGREQARPRERTDEVPQSEEQGVQLLQESQWASEKKERKKY